MFNKLYTNWVRSEFKTIGVAKFSTSERRSIAVVGSNRSRHSRNEIFTARVELDSHADTIVFGKNCVVLQYTGRECDVAPYTDTYDSIKGVPVVQAATAWTSPETSQTYVLIFNEGLWMGDKMDSTLVNPNQLRHYGVTVQDNPYCAEPMYIQSSDEAFLLPLQSQGTVIFATTRTPTSRELEECPRIVLSSERPWDPQSVVFPITERDGMTLKQMREIEMITSQDVVYDIGKLPKYMLSSVRVSGMFAEQQTDVPTPVTFTSKERHSTITPQDLSEKWSIGLEQAKETLRMTTQNIVRSAILPLSRRYKADRMYNRKRLSGEWLTDTMDGRVKSLDGNRYGQVFASKGYFAQIYPMGSKSQAGEALKTFCNEFGVPDRLISDGSKEQTGKHTEFVKQVRKHDIDHHVIEPERPNQNAAESVIRELRKKWFRVMVKKRVPRKLWDYGARWICETMQLTATSAGGMGTSIPLQVVTGETPDISEYLDFGFYDRVWYHENAGLGERKLGRWLGVSKRVGSLMSYWILTPKATVISRTTVQRVTNLEAEVEENKKRFQEYDSFIVDRLEEDGATYDGCKPNPESWAAWLEHDEDFQAEFDQVVGNKDVPEADQDFTPDTIGDTYLNMEIALPRDSSGPEFAKVTKRLRDANGIPIGTANENPILDTRVYEVEFADGHKQSMTANTIATNMFAQVDSEGHRHVLLDEIIDHRTDGTEVKQQDAFILNKSGAKRQRETTKGWEILVQWKDGSTNWVKLKDIKESYPIQVAEYAVMTRISQEPAFAWWVPYVLKKRNRILGKVKSKYWLRTHKFGIRIPKTVKEALQLDRENGNTLWWDAICKEMKNVRIAFEVWNKDVKDIPPGYQEIKCHIIFDIKMGENFRRKARMVAGGHVTDTPAALTYSSVVSRDSVRIAFTIAALNDLKVLSCDIQNAYLTAKCREKIWTRAGPEFGSEEGEIMLVVRALYGLKSSGAAFRALLADKLHDMGYKPSLADPDVWIRPAVKPDGFEYYEMVLCYVDDVLAMSHIPERTMGAIGDKFTIKEGKVETPSRYLGAQLSKMNNEEGNECWTFSSEDYCKAAIANVEKTLGDQGKRLPSKCPTPLMSGYRPELDASPELKASGVQYYQELVGVLRWAVELGRVDILLETSLMSTHMAMPRIGHLNQIFHMFGYLKCNPKRKIAMDPMHPTVKESMFKKHDWYDFYRDAKEAIPENMPVPRGNGMSTHCFVDADLAANKVTRRSQTGILLFCNRAPVMWYSKRQNTVETSTFGSEFIALKIAVELIEGLRYKLRMFGVPVEGPTNIFCDNEAVYTNVSVPESTLKKKQHSISYHRCREAVAAGTTRVAKEGTKTNLADLFTKLMSRPSREAILDRFTY